MAVTCTAANLMALSKCFQGLSKPQLEAIKAYLLAVEAGVEPDPGDLLAAAKCFTGLSIPQLKAIQTYLLCQIANVEVDGLIWGPAPETVDSIAGGADAFIFFLDTAFNTGGGVYTTLSFGNPTTIINDADFSGAVLTTAIELRLLEAASGLYFNSGASLVSVSAPSLVSVGANGLFLNLCPLLTSFDLSSLQTVGGDLDLSGDDLLTSASFPSLVSVGGEFGFNTSITLASLSAPLLQSANRIHVGNTPLLTDLSLPSLSSYPPLGITADSNLFVLNLPACVDDGAGQLDTDLGSMTGLVTLNLASIITITADLSLSGSTNLASFTASAWVPTDGTTIDFTGCSLDIPSVELILRRCVLAGVLTCTISLVGGTNAGTASLSAQGQADVATLGAQVAMNP